MNQQKVSKTRKSTKAPRSESAKSALDFTGERIVPQADNCEPTFASRMYQEHIARYLFAGQIVRDKSVIDIGCGVGYGSRRLAELGASSVHAFDLSEGAIQHAGKHYGHPKVHFETGNAEQFETERKFDVAVCFELIEHVRNARKVLGNIKRVLNREGILVMSTPRALEQKRTHFHEHEFDLDEYISIVREYFPNVEMYVENNHFSSLVTKNRPTELARVECLKDQFGPVAADVFVAVATASTSPLPTMEPVLVLDDDAYVRTLERDVDILHKAENDLRERVDAIETQRAHELAFKDREIDRLTNDFKTLFADSERLKTNLWKAHQQQSEAASKDAEITRLTSEYQILFGQSEELKTNLWKANQQQSEAASKDAEITRLTSEYRILFGQSEELKASLWKAEQHALEAASKDVEISRLTSEYQSLFARSEELSSRLWEAEQRKSEIEAKQLEIVRLTSECKALREQAGELSNRLRESEMAHTDLQQEQKKLREELDLLTVRSADADARRLEAYEFARASSLQADGLRRELDTLKRDIANAVDQPSTVVRNQAIQYDERHRDIVQSMERLFVGAEATHHIAQSPLVERVAELSLALREERQRADHLTREIQALQEFQQHAEDWHRQLLRIRKSVSWRITAPLRRLTKPFRRK